MILFLFGLPLGVLSGLTATASSVFAVPAVRALLGLRPARAVGVGLAVTFFAALASILSYAQHSFVFAGLALLLAVFQVVGAAWGERLTARLPALDRLPWVWGTVIVLGGLAMLAQGLGLLGPRAPWHAGFAHHLWFYPAAALLAAVVGIVSRVVGLGGVLMVPAAIYGLGMPPQAAQGTALVVLVLASLPVMLIHARRGDVEPQSATWLSAGAAFGALAGALWAVTSLTDRSAVVLFGAVLLASGLMILWRKEAVASPEVEEVVAVPTPVAEQPPVSHVAAQENMRQAEVEAPKPSVADVDEGKKEAETARSERSLEVKTEASTLQRTVQDALEQKLKNLEKIISSAAPEPQEKAGELPPTDTTAN